LRAAHIRALPSTRRSDANFFGMSERVVVLHGIVILLWASCYRWLCLPSWESALYFSAGTYATVGSGDVILPPEWRWLGPLQGMIGMLMDGVTVGLLFAAVTHLVDGESR
jgi:Ion channel